MDITENRTSCVRANLFRLSITKSPIFEVQLPGGSGNNEDGFSTDREALEALIGT